MLKYVLGIIFCGSLLAGDLSVKALESRINFREAQKALYAIQLKQNSLQLHGGSGKDWDDLQSAGLKTQIEYRSSRENVLKNGCDLPTVMDQPTLDTSDTFSCVKPPVVGKK